MAALCVSWGNVMRILLVGSLVLLFSGCVSNPSGKDVPPSLWDQVKTYEDTVRWGDVGNLPLFTKVDPDTPILPTKGAGKIRVTAYEASPLRRIDDFRWASTAVIDYVRVDRQIVRQLVDNQVWVSDDKGKSWYLATPVPEFR